MNINTKDYWERRFATGDWEAKGGRRQTRLFAETQVKYLPIPTDHPGTILDFGCGLGDAMPVYRAAYPNASLIGMDISETAIRKCRERYWHIAQFVQGDYGDIAPTDVIIASNVLEHLSNDIEVARHLISRSHKLFIVTPYKEAITEGSEHINSYDETYYQSLGAHNHVVFYSRGWGRSGWSLWYDMYMKNIVRPLSRRTIISRQKQIMYYFENDDGVRQRIKKPFSPHS